MKPTTYENAQRQPATRGDVLPEDCAKRDVTKPGSLSERVTVRLTLSERMELGARAEGAGVELSQYIRREMTRPAGVSRETELVLAEIGRRAELLARLILAQSQEQLDQWRASEIAQRVEAIDDRIFVARATRRELRNG